MKILGLDFTSAPNRQKPITCLETRLDKVTLHLESLIYFTDFVQFDEFLHQPGPWIAGFDFPFGQPRRLIENLNWPSTWAKVVQRIARMGKAGFEDTICAYRQSRLPGDKYHLRITDKKADSRSPMMLDFTPVGKMFYQGAPRLLFSGINIQPCHPTKSNRVALEAYPARSPVGGWENKATKMTRQKSKPQNRKPLAKRCSTASAHRNLRPITASNFNFPTRGPLSLFKTPPPTASTPFCALFRPPGPAPNPITAFPPTAIPSKVGSSIPTY